MLKVMTKHEDKEPGKTLKHEAPRRINHKATQNKSVVESGDGAGSFQCRGVLLLWHMVRQGPAVLAAGAGWETAGHSEILWSRPF